MERRANLRAGLIAAVIANVHRRKGAQSIRPGDWFTDPEEDRMSYDEAVSYMDGWSRRQNRRAVAHGAH